MENPTADPLKTLMMCAVDGADCYDFAVSVDDAGYENYIWWKLRNLEGTVVHSGYGGESFQAICQSAVSTEVCSMCPLTLSGQLPTRGLSCTDWDDEYGEEGDFSCNIQDYALKDYCEGQCHHCTCKTHGEVWSVDFEQSDTMAEFFNGVEGHSRWVRTSGGTSSGVSSCGGARAPVRVVA